MSAREILVKMRKDAKRMKKVYEKCTTDRYCSHDKVMKESYAISRDWEADKITALTYAIKLIDKNKPWPKK